MKTIFKTSLLTAAAICATSLNANALLYEAPINDMSFVNAPSINTLTSMDKPVIDLGAKIGVVRIDKGRLITAPVRELSYWSFLDKRSRANFVPVSPAALLKNLPDVPMDGRDSDNKLDEIRMTASDLRMDYVLIYGMGKDAQWGSFAGKSMMETGFIIDGDAISPRGGAKALLVNTYTGQVYGTVTSEEVEFGVRDLTNKVETLVNELGTIKV